MFIVIIYSTGMICYFTQKEGVFVPYLDGIFYELDIANKTATIRNITKTNSNPEIKIPSNVKGYKVVKIASEAFMHSKHLREISLPITIEVIGKRAFKECQALTQVKLESRQINIGEHAFFGCKNLMVVSSANWNTTIFPTGYGVFQQCINVQFIDIDFGGSVRTSTFDCCNAITALRFAHNTTLKTDAIKNCPKLTTIYINGQFDASRPMLRKMRKYKIICDELSNVIELVYDGYWVEIDDNTLPF